METSGLNDKITSENDLGSMRIADEVVSTIAGLAAVEVEGVAAMSGGFAAGLTEILGRKNLGKGVKVEVGDKEAAIDVFIVVQFGYPIPSVSRTVQAQVKQAVETMTGLNVTAINVNVVGVSMNKDKPEEELPEA